jgi:flagellar motor switch protein FliM
VAVAVEIRIGESIGMMNIAMPSIIIKMMRQKFDQQWSLRKSGSTEQEQVRMLDLIRNAVLPSEVLLTGPQLLLRDLMNLEEGDVISFERSTTRPLDLVLNGAKKYRGEVVSRGRRAAFRVAEKIQEPTR